MMQAKSLAKTVPPGLHFIATPIGAARDITLRALDILAGSDVLAAEDTRTLRHLMEIHGVALNGRPLWAYHDHNGEAVRPRILAALAEGKSVAYASEAGTPLVADPGYQLSKAAIAAGHVVLAAPGPSAVLAALTVSGLPSDKFMFVGFPPNTSAARLSFLSEMAQIPATLVFYESPKRLSKLLTDMVSSLGEERRAVVCRELTKKFEETTRGTLGELVAVFDGVAIKGEIVVLVDRDHKAKADPITVETALRSALAQMSVKDAAAMVAESLALPRRDVYQVALNIVKDR
ncbi:MAG: 16S rRNA (cytidine(1402)-2'-O)-methyltransferase [Paracoccaceae bacterium]|nr:16S rRNA (cytidine(1402)-2'-O)-methyltransferase [Paracoccaceae bacterium]MDP5332331.1 16S rRNA (cytidine(1402)-2'-O)-methyltransferase [Paracoccaceae bacterium]MDP5352377.1 16S rRNA (cytidine(1402)-2'-O)-methyltransferase [Paracoccaceae bacterium]MDP5354129.1 16S rRNA (cytidine(1402)-2'-O)-methyltransferase [Paracoccaceae bacterium]MDP5356352.1 16S rRNA (cytidine(1402)-2'-O)-methyltransferase [Paracoccaceae bacterium]